MSARNSTTLDVDLTALPPAIVGGGDVDVVFWAGETPLGRARVPAADLPMDRDRLAALAARITAPAVVALTEGDATAAEPPLSRLRTTAEGSGGDVAVVICTRDRPEQLRAALASVVACDPPAGEVVVVDNAPRDGATAAVVRDFPDVRYVLEPRPGLSIARNTGLSATSAPLVAFTDDDVVVHRRWVGALAAAFTDPEVGSVTGLVLPLRLDTPGAQLFEAHGGWDYGYLPRRFDRAWFDKSVHTGVPVWHLGAGANMAVRRRALERVGDFDERLGAGAAGCSEDTELWFRLLEEGWVVRYEPTAVVRHEHRSDAAGVASQLRAYMRGHVAALGVQFGRYRHTGEPWRIAVQMPRYYLRRLRRILLFHRADPMLAVEVGGYVAGLRSLAEHVRTPRRGRAARRRYLAANPWPDGWFGGLFYRDKMRAAFRVAPDEPVDRILELGAGSFSLSRHLYPDATLVEVDLDVAHATVGDSRRFVCADGTRLPFPDGSFDAVALFDVLEHIVDDAAAVDEVRRLVRPGGFVLLTTPCADWRYPHHRWFRPWARDEAELLAEWGHVRRGYDLERLAELFGGPPVRRATFVNPLTALSHDIEFSRLRRRPRRLVAAAIAPVAWLGYSLHHPHLRGAEVAAMWRVP